jgi:two-component system response regulator NreC
VHLMIVDNQPLYREGIKKVLLGMGNMEVAAELSDGRSAIAFAARGGAEGGIVDTCLPGMDGVTTIRELLRVSSRLKLVVLTAHPGRQLLAEALEAGAVGYLLKTDPVDTLVTALRVVARGGRYISRSVQGPEQSGSSAETRVPLDTLTPRERAVFRLAIKGLTTRRIAAELDISLKTVETHRTHVNRKLGCNSPAALVRFAAFNDLLDEQVAPLGGGTLTLIPGEALSMGA